MQKSGIFTPQRNTCPSPANNTRDNINPRGGLPHEYPTRQRDRQLSRHDPRHL